mmetsp:Transcript_43934/g.138704  ORF Transcript_43934/g.138704 Transcript_43934/m.138704 type:complete len:97 (+) Transcript_43934:2056-2346(+)
MTEATEADSFKQLAVKEKWMVTVPCLSNNSSEVTYTLQCKLKCTHLYQENDLQRKSRDLNNKKLFELSFMQAFPWLFQSGSLEEMVDSQTLHHIFH